MGSYGLSTYIWNNRLKSLLLLAGFPFLLLLICFAFALVISALDNPDIGADEYSTNGCINAGVRPDLAFGRNQGMALNIYPNPFRTSTSILINNQLSVNGGMVQILDISGKLLRTIPISAYRSPIAGIQWNAQDQPAGTYLILIKAGEKRITKQVTLIH